MAFTSLFLDTSAGSTMTGMGDYISHLSKTIGVDVFEEDRDNVVFQTNELVDFADVHGSWSTFLHSCGWWHVLQDACQGGTH